MLLRAGLAAFTVSEGSVSDRKVSTYMLYRASDLPSHIDTAAGEDSSQRQLGFYYINASTSGQERGILESEITMDDSSEFAYLTLATSVFNDEGEQVELEPASELNRCYFKRGSRIIEIQLYGSTFQELREVPVR